ncbi:unnamed protein product [Phaeothamnion confervicola]
MALQLQWAAYCRVLFRAYETSSSVRFRTSAYRRRRPRVFFFSSERSLSAAAASNTHAKPAGDFGLLSPKQPQDGWPWKWKLAGASILGVAVPWLGCYAIRHDRETREFVERFAPSFVDWLRRREGGSFQGEDAEERAFRLAMREEQKRPSQVTLMLSTGDALNVRVPSSDAPLAWLATAAAEKLYGAPESSLSSAPVIILDFYFQDDDGVATEQRGISKEDADEERDGFAAVIDYDGGEETSSIGNGLRPERGRETRRGVPPDVAACNSMSWWAMAAQSQEQRREKLLCHRQQEEQKHQKPALAGAAAGAATKRVQQREQEKNAAIVAELQRRIGALEAEKRTGTRTIDDIDEDIAPLQSELRKRTRRRFLGLF